MYFSIFSLSVSAFSFSLHQAYITSYLFNFHYKFKFVMMMYQYHLLLSFRAICQFLSMGCHEWRHSKKLASINRFRSVNFPARCSYYFANQRQNWEKNWEILTSLFSMLFVYRNMLLGAYLLGGWTNGCVVLGCQLG